MKSLSDPKHKISRQFEALAHYRDDGFSYPLTAEIDLTWRCALNCKGCHSKWLHQDQELKPQEIIHILNQLSKYGCKSITWSGGGDPLEHPYWGSALEFSGARGLSQGIYTYMPNPTQAKINLISFFCDFVYSHPFKTKNLSKQQWNKSGDCTWTAGFLLDAQNWGRIMKMVESVDLNFFDFCDFRPLCPTNEPNPKEMDYHWVEDALNFLEGMYHDNPQVTWAEYKFKDLLKPDKGRNYGACLSTDFVAVIGPNGDVYECVNRRGFQDSVLGNLLQEDLADIWKRKSHSRTDFIGCRELCRNHEMNKELYQLLGPAPKHAEFV